MNNLKHEFCCNEMYNAVVDNIVDYEKMDRSYDLPCKNGTVKEIAFCPWCGSKLPKDLIDEYYEILEKEFNITVVDHTHFSNVPEEFKTDEWWKKRGL